MKKGAGLEWDRARVSRLFRLSAVLTVALLVGWFLLLSFPAFLPRRIVWKTRLLFVLVMEGLYVVVSVIALLACPFLAGLVCRARLKGKSVPWAGRGLVLCATILAGLALMELATAAWKRHNALENPARAGSLARARDGHRQPLVLSARDIALPREFPESKAAGTIEIVVIGESSAAGVPYNHFGLSAAQLAAWSLSETFPKRTVHVEMIARGGHTLESQHQTMARLLRRRPDVVMIYCGHNEFSSRFSWWRKVGYYRDRVPTSFWETLVGGVERHSPLCGLMRQIADHCRIAIPPRPGERRALIDVPIYSSAEFVEILADFESRLERIVSYIEQIGAIPLLIIPPSNDSGFEPNRSYLPAGTPYAERQVFARDFQSARAVESAEPQLAITRYRTLLKWQPEFAEAHYRLARVLEGQRAWDEAYRHDVAARDFDGYPMRCPTVFQDAYRRVSSRHQCILIDAQSYFHAIGRHGLLDDRLFNDAMHPSLRGQIALAQAILQGLRDRRAFEWPGSTPAPTLDPRQVAKHFGLGPKQWEWLCAWGVNFYDVTAGAHYDTTARLEKRKAFQRALELIASRHDADANGLPNIGIPEAVPPVTPGTVFLGPSFAPPTSTHTSTR
jgi:lysophospholipase L1-like esterase